MGVLLMLITIAGGAAALLLLIFALAAKQAWLAKFTIGGALIWVAAYSLLLGATSFVSEEKVLPLNSPKEYCGFYLDCHLHTVVTGVRTAHTIGRRAAAGTFYIVSVKVFLDSKNPAIAFRLLEPNARVTPDDGERYARDAAAESELPTAGVSLGSDIRGRETIEKEIVFDLPEGTVEPRLLITEGYGIDKWIEAVLIGDEDSLWHKHVYFDISEQNLSAGVL